ncbi:unnamed protein product, partial [Callosobruchus maculatus]
NKKDKHTFVLEGNDLTIISSHVMMMIFVSKIFHKIHCLLTLEEGKYDFLFLVFRRNTIFQSELKSAQT